MDLEQTNELLERIAAALEGVQREVRLLPAPLEEMCTKSHAWARLYEIGNAAEIWAEKELEE